MADKRHSLWARFGTEVKRIRVSAGLSQRQLAKKCTLSPSMVSAIERGTRPPRREHAESLDAALDTNGELTRRWMNHTDQDMFPAWFREVATLERQATEIRWYHTTLVPGLVQTEAYARALLTYGRPWDGPAEIESLIESRMVRGKLLDEPSRPLLWIVVDEAVLRRGLGGPKLMAEQRSHLLELIERSALRMQIVPSDAPAHPGLSGPFRIMAFGDRPPVAYVEHMLGGEVIDHADKVRQCNTIFGALQAEALSPNASVDLIHDMQGAFDV